MRGRKAKLNFLSKEKKQKKRIYFFIAAFVVFLCILAGASLLLFMDSLDYNIHNLHKNNANIIENNTELTTSIEPIQVKPINVLLIFYDSNELSGLYFLTTDSKEPKIQLQYIDLATKWNTETFLECYQDRGVTALKSAVETHYGITIDRYIKQSENDLKKIIGKIGNVTVKVQEPIQYNQKQDSLYLEAGLQNLTGDLFLRYLHYVEPVEKEKAIQSLVSSTLEALHRSEKSSALLNYLFNHTDTDFSVVDNETGGYIPMLISLKDKVYVKGT